MWSHRVFRESPRDLITTWFQITTWFWIPCDFLIDFLNKNHLRMEITTWFVRPEITTWFWTFTTWFGNYHVILKNHHVNLALYHVILHNHHVICEITTWFGKITTWFWQSPRDLGSWIYCSEGPRKQFHKEMDEVALRRQGPRPGPGLAGPPPSPLVHVCSSD